MELSSLAREAWSPPDVAPDASSLFYIFLCGPRCVEEVIRRIKLEWTIEWPMLLQGRWKILAFGIMMQYVHGIFTQLAHRMHRPGEALLHDVGFDLTPELGPGMFWVSELIFGTLFVMFFIWTFTPFFFYRKRFYTVVLWCRLLMVLVVCQVLRILSFSFTQLPGPAHHCRHGEDTAIRSWPDHWYDHLLVDIKRVSTKSCGDLIFSSHTIFMLTGILAYHEFGTNLILKTIAWTSGVAAAILIVASRKHYTVDIVIAWYTVPLVFYTMQRRWTTIRPDNIDPGDETCRQMGSSASSSKSGLNLKRDEEEDWRVSVKLESDPPSIACLDPPSVEDTMECGNLSTSIDSIGTSTVSAISSSGTVGTAHISVTGGRSATSLSSSSSQRRVAVSSMQSEAMKQGQVDSGEGADKGGGGGQVGAAGGRLGGQGQGQGGTNYLRVDVWWRGGGDKAKAIQRQQV